MLAVDKVLRADSSDVNGTVTRALYVSYIYSLLITPCRCHVIDPGLQSAFVIGRPPGHHAGPNG